MWHRDPDPVEPHLDLELLRFDPDRLWWEDMEADVAPGNDAYVEALRGWARISRGTFALGAIREEELGRDEIRVHVRIAGRDHVLTPRPLGDYLDIGLLDQVNALILGPYRLLCHAAFDQTAAVLAVDEHERRSLEARGWRFADHDRL